MAIMIGNGANAGSLSPIAPTGVIVNGVMADIGLGGNELQTYLNNMMAHMVIAFAAYFLLGGWRLLGRRHHGALIVPSGNAGEAAAAPADGSEAAGGGGDTFQQRHWITIGVIGALLVGVIFFNLHVGLGAFAGAIVLALLKAGDENEAVKLMPWRVIMMVCGVTVLISVLDETGGLELFTRVLAGVSSANTVTGVMAFTTGFISIYSSTSGVVLPAFLPTVPGLAEQVGGVTPLAIASAMNVGAHLAGRLRPLHARRPLHGRRAASGRQPQAVQQADGVGALDDHRRRLHVLAAVHRLAHRHRLAASTVRRRTWCAGLQAGTSSLRTGAPASRPARHRPVQVRRPPGRHVIAPYRCAGLQAGTSSPRTGAPASRPAPVSGWPRRRASETPGRGRRP